MRFFVKKLKSKKDKKSGLYLSYFYTIVYTLTYQKHEKLTVLYYTVLCYCTVHYGYILFCKLKLK